MPIKCEGCGYDFASRNGVFRHLKETNAACLPPESYADFQRYILTKERKKVVLLYGYIILPGSDVRLKSGQDAAFQLLQTLEEDILHASNSKSDVAPQTTEPSKINRSYGTCSRSEDEEILRQDEETGAVTEVLATRLPVLMGSVEDWLSKVNALLRQKQLQIQVFGRLDMPLSKFNAEMDVTYRRMEYLLPVDFLVPENETDTMENFFNSLPSFSDSSYVGQNPQNQKYLNEDHSQLDYEAQSETQTPEPGIPRLEALNIEKKRPSRQTLDYLYALKKKMQRLATQVVLLDDEGHRVNSDKGNRQCHFKRQAFTKNSIDGKDDKLEVGSTVNETDVASCNAGKMNGNSRKGRLNGKSSVIPPNDSTNETQGLTKTKSKSSKKKVHALCRKRFHNFTPKAMAHDFFAYRRLDRLYQRATLRFPDALYDEVENEMNGSVEFNRTRPFFALCMTGDMFLHGQTSRVIGLLIAIARGEIDEEFIDCVFDEDYPHLVPTPEAPAFAMYASEALYTNMEGKCQLALSPRHCEAYPGGWNDLETRQKVDRWQAIMREEVAKFWLQQGVDTNDGCLVAEKKWTEEVLKPWAVKAREQLNSYRHWKKNLVSSASEEDRATENIHKLFPSLGSIDQTVPPLYEKVLKCLRDANASGLWPSTTPNRQLVMVSTPFGGEEGLSPTGSSIHSSLSAACIRAKCNSNDEARSSAYEFKEGEGGASGSFSVGAMPGDQGCSQPKGNELFPELMKAAFELEIALCPDREHSSTIAINRNAQFRPHTDSGAGVGQGTSLIVALGDFVGGELVVEGEKKDIRYNAIEFNGWTQRHWTMPFQGERYSLVWFTPKGCAGVHGIDLCA